MKSIFSGHFRPTQKEFTQLWNDCEFVVDANVLLNLYRYSSATRKELEKALTEIKDRAFIPHQAAKEFLKNRLSVTAGQSSEYTKAISSLNSLLTTLSSKDRHPFLPEEELPQFKEYSDELIFSLEKQKESLLEKLTEDEILSFVDELFTDKTGEPFKDSILDEISKEGEIRYEREIPPGYKDSKKDSSNDPYRKFGDLIVWKQTIEYAKEKNKPVIFITDDKKEDWWLEQSGRTIGPRPEIIEEFCKESSQRFWMYTVEKFIQESAKISKTTVSDDVIEELIKISADITKSEYGNGSPISVTQEPIEINECHQSGLLIVTLDRSMKYATGTGKFSPHFLHIPEFDVEFIESPYEDKSNIGISFGCGTVKNFNVHLRARKGLLEPGDYIFKYKANDSYTE